MTREVLATIRVMAALQDRWGVRACHRYIVTMCFLLRSDLLAVRPALPLTHSADRADSYSTLGHPALRDR